MTHGMGLIDPDRRPGADVVIFDGQCRFCQKQVMRLHWFDSRNQLSYLSLHDPRVAERYPDLSHDQLMDQMYVVSQDGRRFGGARAIRYLSRRLPRLWWLAPLMHIPFTIPLWQWLYHKVAVRRYKLSQAFSDDCDQGGCKVHLDK